MERTTLTLVQSLPGISRWFEVDKRELVSHAGGNALISFPARNFTSHMRQRRVLIRVVADPVQEFWRICFISLMDQFVFILESLSYLRLVHTNPL